MAWILVAVLAVLLIVALALRVTLQRYRSFFRRPLSA
jgi:hypothetical protein